MLVSTDNGRFTQQLVGRRLDGQPAFPSGSFSPSSLLSSRLVARPLSNDSYRVPIAVSILVRLSVIPPMSVPPDKSPDDLPDRREV